MSLTLKMSLERTWRKRSFVDVVFRGAPLTQPRLEVISPSGRRSPAPESHGGLPCLQRTWWGRAAWWFSFRRATRHGPQPRTSWKHWRAIREHHKGAV